MKTLTTYCLVEKLCSSGLSHQVILQFFSEEVGAAIQLCAGMSYMEDLES
jgi:hypothetical protein